MLMGERKSSNTKYYHTIAGKFCYFPINKKSEIVFGNIQNRGLLCRTRDTSLLSASSGGSLFHKDSRCPSRDQPRGLARKRARPSCALGGTETLITQSQSQLSPMPEHKASLQPGRGFLEGASVTSPAQSECKHGDTRGRANRSISHSATRWMIPEDPLRADSSGTHRGPTVYPA